MTDKEDITNQAVAEGGSYELIQRSYQLSVTILISN